jgi:predicted HTH transcriptional regulator
LAPDDNSLSAVVAQPLALLAPKEQRGTGLARMKAALQAQGLDAVRLGASPAPV